MKKIVIVEDELFMREELVSILQKAHYEIYCITNFDHTVKEILNESPDLVLLDLNLPGVTGFEICKEVRKKSTVPILVLTSRDQLKDELHALGLGADEYLNKPCHKERLLARITNLLRRFEDRDYFIEYKGIRLDVQTFTMYVKGISLVLPENQGKIMELLLAYSGKVVTKEQLFQKLWGTTEFVDENALQVNITRLKKTMNSLEIDYKITTVRGKGYYIEAIGDMEDA